VGFAWTRTLVTVRFLAAIVVLWLCGVALRLTILAVPPVMQLIKSDLALSGTEVGVLAGLPVTLFAAAALAGSVLIARFGLVRTLLAGLLVSGIASGLRGFSRSAFMLDATTVLVGFGVAIMQPGMPPLVRSSLPKHVGFGTAVYTNGLLVGEIIPASLTLPLILPLSGGSWRLSLVVWGVAVLFIALCVAGLAPWLPTAATSLSISRGRWWPDWSNGLVWRLGLIFGSVNSIYFATNAFLPVYLASEGRELAIGPALTALNLGQLPASFLLLAIADRMAGKAWPYAAAGLGCALAIAGLVSTTGWATIAASALLGFAGAVTLVLTLVLPPLLCRSEDLASTTAAMFTLSYTFAIVTPIVSGAVWDLTGVPAAAFAPIGFWAVVLIFFASKMKVQQLNPQRPQSITG
jgi:MFS transporter, CP family, cyanate transporter